jgi:nucleotide-binding universal stress UspA family protein
MKMLLCSIGSKQRRATLRFGAAVAQALHADVTLLGVVDNERRAAELGLALDEVARELAERTLPVQSRVQVGNAEEIVLAEMDRTIYDLVVLGALGDKRSRRSFLSSVAMRIIEQARTSVLVVKGGRETLSRVLIGASGSEVGHLSIWAGAALACGAKARVTVLHVIDVLPAMYTGLEQMEETLAEFLQAGTDTAREIKWAAQVVKAECEISEVKLRRGIAADEILREGEMGDHDLIVIGSSRSAGGLVRALMGDLTREIVTRAKRPVLVVRPVDRELS